jgi:hypothetical protein
MKQSCVFVQSMGTVICRMPSGLSVTLPVVPGILKHPSPEMLPALIRNPEVACKYTREALRKASWPILRLFPKDWLRQCIPDARLPQGRAAALAFLLS